MWTDDMSPSEFSLRTPEGRADLRGFPFPSASEQPVGVLGGLFVEQAAGRTEWRDVVIEDVDFSGVDARFWLVHNSALVNCVFDTADCSNWTVMQSELTDCSFRQANLQNATLGILEDGRGNTFRRVDFTRADLRDARFSDSEYYDITFDRARMDRVQFWFAVLERCHFSGWLKRFYVDGLTSSAGHRTDHRMVDVDFSTCRVDDFQIYNYDTSSVELPRDVDLVRDAGAVFRRAHEQLQQRTDDGARGLLRVIGHWLAQGAWTGGDFAADALGPDLLAAIRRAEPGS